MFRIFISSRVRLTEYEEYEPEIAGDGVWLALLFIPLTKLMLLAVKRAVIEFWLAFRTGGLAIKYVSEKVSLKLVGEPLLVPVFAVEPVSFISDEC